MPSSRSVNSSILSTRATYFRKSLFRGKAVLFADRIEIRSIGLTGPVRITVTLSSLSYVKADAAIGGKSIYLVFEGGETVRLELARGAALWDLKISERLRMASDSSEIKTPDSLRNDAPRRGALRNRYTSDRVADGSPNFPDSVNRTRNAISKSGDSVWAGSGGDSSDHTPVQFPTPSEN